MPYKAGDKWRATPQHKGKRLRTKLFSTKKEALKYEIKQKALAKQRERNLQEGPDLLTFCSKYLLYANRFSKNTLKEKQSLCKRILKTWGPNTPVESITPEIVETYLADQAAKRSANASNRDRKNLLAMWTKGCKTYGLLSNPVANTERFAHDRQPQYTPTTEDVLRTLAAATQKERIFLDCYLQTGARRSEIFRWTWNDDINFEKREVRLGTRKTNDGSMEYEWLPMSDDLYESLWYWWQNRTVKNSPYVFVNDIPTSESYGKPYTTRRKFMKGLCKRAGVKSFGFHALRRYVASVLADTHKVSAKRIQRILRHKNVTTTERYIQNINKDLKETMNLLSEKKQHICTTQNKKEATTAEP